MHLTLYHCEAYMIAYHIAMVDYEFMQFSQYSKNLSSASLGIRRRDISSWSHLSFDWKMDLLLSLNFLVYGLLFPV